MTKRDHILRAIRHESDEIVPMSINLTWPAYMAYGERLLKDYYNPDIMEDYRSGFLALNEAVNLTVGNFMLQAPFPWWDWDYEHIPAAYHDPYDVPTEMPPIIRHYDAQPMFEKTKIIREKYGVYMGAFVWGSHWEKAFFTRGIENFLADFAAEPEFVQQLLDFVIRNNMEALDILLKCPDYDAVLLGGDWGTQNDLIMSLPMWRKMIQPGELKQYEVVRAAGKHVFVHSCGCIVKLMPDLYGMDIDVLNPVQPECMDIEFLKREYGDKITFWGGISTQSVLPYGTPAEVRKETERVIRLMRDHGGYIASSSQDIQTDVPYENVRAFIDTLREYAGLQ